MVAADRERDREQRAKPSHRVGKARVVGLGGVVVVVVGVHGRIMKRAVWR